MADKMLTFDDLLAACKAGGPSILTINTELAPAAGPHGGVAPARYTDGGSNGVYSYEKRYIDGVAQMTVLIDSKQSQSNRAEEQQVLAIRDGVEPYTLIPRIRLVYGEQDFLDMELPHRAWDGHIRAGKADGKSVTAHPTYVAARNATPANASALLNLSPASLVYGSWDSTRATHQARYRTCLTSEIIGVLADQSSDRPETPRRGGARCDEISPSVRLSTTAMKALVDAQRSELSPKNIAGIENEIKKGKGPSKIGLGSLPPNLTALGLVACSRIIRSQVLSFAALRQIRFGAGVEGDAACRALLAAFALAGVTRSNAELVLRANCDLVELDEPVVKLDQRGGKHLELSPLTVGEADALFAEAIEHARKVAGLNWTGQEFVVQGDETILHGAQAETEE